MRRRPSIKNIKRFPIVFSVLITFYFTLWIFNCFSRVGNVEILNVDVKNLKERTYKNVELGDNYFVTGTEGRLFWKVKNLEEAFVIGIADQDAVIKIFDLLYFLTLNILIYVLVYFINEETIFSSLTVGLRVLGFLIALYPGMLLVNYEVSGNLIEKLTGNQFTVQYRSLDILKYVIIAFLLNMVFPFISKGKSLQKEQELTI